MTIKPIIAAGAALCVLLAAPGAHAAPVTVRSGEDVRIEGKYDEMVLAAGEAVTVSAVSTDTVFAAGGDVSLRDARLADAILAGGEVNISGAVAEDVIVAGGQIDLSSGQIGDDLIAAGGQIRLRPDAKVTGSAIIAGGQLTIEAPIGGDLYISGGRVKIDAPVAGNVVANGAMVTLGANARIGGDLTYRTSEFSRAAEATVAGKTTALAAPKRIDETRKAQAAAVFAGFGLVIAAGVVLLAMALALAAPAVMTNAAASVRARPLSSLGVGVLVAIVTPVAALMLLATIIGAPIAFVLGAAFLLLCLVASSVGAFALAMAARARLRKDAPLTPSAAARALWAGVGAVALLALAAVPLLGQLVWLVVFWLGLGALAIALWRLLAREPGAPGAVG